MMRSAYRFCVGSPLGPRSGIWKLLVQNGQAYLTSGSRGPGIKVSFHADGRSHYGNRELEKLGMFPHLDMWTAPRDRTGQMSIPFTLFVPAGELDVAPVLADSKKPISWIPLPPPESVVEITIVLSERLPLENWPGQSDAMQVLINLTASAERVCWVVWRYNESLYPTLAAIIAEKRAGMLGATTLWRLGALDKTRPGTRLIVPLKAQDGVRAFIDASYLHQAEAA